MQVERAKRDLTPPQPAAAPEVEAVPEEGHDEERGGHAGGVRGEEAGAPEGRARCRGDGEYRAEDGSRAEARETVDGAESEGCQEGTATDPTPQAFDGPE